MQHERGAGLLLELCRSRYSWLHDNLGLRSEAVLFELLEQRKQYPAVWEGFLRAGGVALTLTNCLRRWKTQKAYSAGLPACPSIGNRLMKQTSGE
jgi:hypothetical protein